MSGKRFTLDTNILVYAVDNRAGPRQARAAEVIERAARRDCQLTFQAVSEFYAAVTRKGMVPARDAAMIAADWMALFPCVAASGEAVRLALDAAATGRAGYWDALLVASAAEAGCEVVLTEDLATGGTLFGVRVVNPFVGDGGGGGAGRVIMPEPPAAVRIAGAPGLEADGHRWDVPVGCAGGMCRWDVPLG